MSRTRVAVLGAGFMGGTHARAYRTRDDVDVVAIYAHTAKRGEALAAEVGASFTDSLATILADDSIDAIDVCLPTPAHRLTVEASLAVGKHVMLEKPLALTAEDGEALVALANATDRVFMVAHVLRFWPEYVELKRVIDSGVLGRPIAAVTTRRQPFPEWSELLKNADQTGGAIYDMLVHDYDMLNWILGRPVSVAANGIANPRSGGMDHAQVLVTYEGGTGIAEGGMIQPESYPFTSRVEVVCENGAIEYHFQAGGRSFEVGQPTNTLTLYPATGDPEVLAAPATDAYENETGYFIECVQAGVPADRATPQDALLAQRVGLAAIEAAASGLPVAI